MTAPLVEIDQVSFAYRDGGFDLRIPAVRVERRETVAVVGPSGSGKTTLLTLVAGIRRPDRGRIVVDDVAVTELNDAARRRFRIRRIGLIFQEFELLDYLHVLDNILLPYRIAPGLALTAEVRARATRLAHAVGLGDLLRRPVRRLSQGERQRVALCRAVVIEPRLLLADEPTGSLDPTTARVVLDLLFRCADEADAALVMVTHDHDLLDRFDRVIDARDFHPGGAGSHAAIDVGADDGVTGR